MRSQAVQITGKFTYRETLLALWLADPTVTVQQALLKTGAPQSVTLKVRRELVEAGVLKAGGRKW